MDIWNLSYFMIDVGWLCLTSHRQRGHLETAPPFTVPCEGRDLKLDKYTVPTGNGLVLERPRSYLEWSRVLIKLVC